MQFLFLAFVFVCMPHVSSAFDYGPVGNNIFWVALAGWSMAVAYILLQKRDALWRVIGSFAHALLTPGVRPARRQRGRRHSGLPQNPHIYVPHEKEVVKSTQAIPQPTQPHTYVMPPHVPAPRPVQQAPAAPRPVVHSTHMSTPAPAHHASHAPAAHAAPTKSAASVPTPVELQGVMQTKDTLTLEIIAGVPKMILKREKR
jgi:hypothetical protein